MIYRKLGRTGLELSVIGLGTMTWGVQNNQQQGFEQMDHALDAGINFFDTAEMYAVPSAPETYGTTETIIGNWFAERNNRDRVILASKICGPGLALVREGENRIDAKNLQLALDASLERLQTDYIDLYQLHWPNRGSYHFGQLWGFDPKFDAIAEEASFIEVLQTLQRFIDEGKIRHIGLSNETAWGMAKWLQLAERENLPRMASIQNEYSLLCRNFEPDLSEMVMAEDVSLLAWSPLVRGMISGKYLNGALPEGARLTIETRKEHRVHPLTDEAIERYIDLANVHDLDVCQMALAFVHSRPFLTSTLIGATTMDQLKSNIGSIELELDGEVIEGIEAIRRNYPMPF